MEQARCTTAVSHFPPGAVLPGSKQQGAVLNEVCLANDFLSSQSDGAAAVLSREGKGEEEEREKWRGGERVVTALHTMNNTTVCCRSLWIYVAPLVLHLSCVWTSPALHL